MLDTYYCVLAESTGEKDKEDIQTRWEDIQKEVVGLISYRISNCNCRWYNEANLDTLEAVYRFSPQEYDSIFYLPHQGILAEVFFLNACLQNGIDCVPCRGSQDIKGKDFVLSDSLGDEYVDVTINKKRKSIKRKIRKDSCPTLLLPWTYKPSNNGNLPLSYAAQYLKSGGFDGKGFLARTLDLNIILLQDIRDGKYSDSNGSFPTQREQHYENNLEKILYLLRDSIY